MMYLGKMFLYGQGLPVDYDMALLWFEKAAQQVTTARVEVPLWNDESSLCWYFPLPRFNLAFIHNAVQFF